ncbi:MAG: hypothetical protein M3Y20_00160 [Actinomycetota bacterium]|nr:hypothetical protein [Actinomycetota bacterium]
MLVPLSTLLGTRDEAALLVGHGPIDPELARSLARGGTWRRLVTDPQSGTVLDVGRTRYAPPADLAELVRFRDLECVRPGCSTSAWHSELDHVKPFDQEPARRGPARGGPSRDGPFRDGPTRDEPTRDEPTRGGTTRDGTTSAANLAPLSKGCHQIKTHGGFNLERTSSTTYRWSTPTGHVYDVETSPSLRALAPNDPIHRAREDLGHLARRDAPPPSEQGRPSPPYGDTTRIEGAPDPGPPPY